MSSSDGYIPRVVLFVCHLITSRAGMFCCTNRLVIHVGTLPWPSRTVVDIPITVG